MTFYGLLQENLQRKRKINKNLAESDFNNRELIIKGFDYSYYYEKEILNLIKVNSKITREVMALKINKNIRTIQRITNTLVSKGYILRIGNNRFGYWEVLK